MASSSTSPVSLAWTRRARANGSRRSTIPSRRCCSCRAACPSRSRRSSWTVSCRRCCPCWKPVPAARWCCARRCARWTKWPACWPTPSMTPATNGRCSSRATPRAATCSNALQAAHPVLVGSASFWEGIDLPGDVLTLVAIDKLPFAPPDDPVIAAARLSRAGRQSFRRISAARGRDLAQAGRGRLIRTESDWGVLMVGDGRLVEKPYGKRLWRGLPPFAARASWTRRWRSTGARARAAERRASRAGS